MKKAYIAGPLFDDHERVYLEKITQIVESLASTHFYLIEMLDWLLVILHMEKKVKVFDVDMEYLKPADLVVALLSGRDVDSGTAAEIGYAYKASKRLIGVSAKSIKPINNFVWGIFNYGKDIVEDLDQLKSLLSKEYSAT